MTESKHRPDQPPAVAPLPGFVLTHHCVDGPAGLSFHLWLQTPHGPTLAVVPDQEAVFFVRSEGSHCVRAALSSLKGWRLQALALKNPAGEPVSGLYFKRQGGLLDARARLAAKGLACYEEDVRPVERYLMERFICGSVEICGVVTQHNGYRRIDRAQLKRGDYLPTLRWLSLDIETTMQADQIFSVGLYAPNPPSPPNAAQGEGSVQGEGSTQAFQRVLMVGEAPLDRSPIDAPPFVQYVADERALLQALGNSII